MDLAEENVGAVKYSKISKLTKHAGNRYEWCETLFWADGGMVGVVHLPTNEYRRVPPETWMLRAAAHAQEISRMQYGDERQAMTDLVNAMREVAKEAHDNGSLCDPKFREHLHNTKSPGYIQVPDMPNHKMTGTGIIVPSSY